MKKSTKSTKSTKTYKSVSANSLKELEVLVNKFIKEGWVCYGPIADYTGNVTRYQLMDKP
jgi:hypothetical protein